MFDLYIANKNYSSWSLRPWVLMKVLEIPFNEHLMPFEGGFGASHDTFIHFSPSGLVPCLVDKAVDDGLAVWIHWPSSSIWPSSMLAFGQVIKQHAPGRALPLPKCTAALERCVMSAQ